MSVVRGVRVLVSLAFVACVSWPGVTAASDTGHGVIASFEGGWINLAEGWGEATACTSDGITTACYRTEAEMNAASNPVVGATARSLAIVPLLTCASSLKLYRSTSFTGAVLQLTSRGVYTNLSTYGFDNDTSSYQVGACTSYFYDGASGGTPLYPGTTTANSSATSMLTGWDNRVSSVYIA
jgi:hypothetical protein